MHGFLKILVCLYFLAAIPAAGAGEKLVYSVWYKGEDFSMKQGEVFALDPETGRSELIFTDDTLAIVLNRDVRVAPGGRLFANATECDDHGRRIHSRVALYELSIDGTNSYRKVAPVADKAPFARFFVNSSGTRLGSVKWLQGGQYLLIHETENGELVSEIDASGIFMDCYQSSIGYLRNSDTIFFSLETGDVHVTSDESYALVGTYIMDEPGTNVIRLDSLPAREGYRSIEMVRLLGGLATGELIYAAAERDAENVNRMTPAIFRVSAPGADTLRVTDISFGYEAEMPLGIAADFELSPSGKYLAALNGLPSVNDQSKEIWLKDVETGREKVVFTLAVSGLHGPYMEIIGWLE